MQTVKLGIIGCGIIASELHAPALESLAPRFDVCAFCNRSEEKAIKLADRFGYGKDKVWSEWQTFLKEADIEAVLICLPIEMNYTVSEAAARAGKHVICEKPLGASLEEAKKSVQLPEKYGITYLVAENYHYHPTFREAAKLVSDGALGELQFLSWNVIRFLEQTNKYALTNWRINNQYPGGYVYDGGVHNTHVIQMIAGKVKKVTGLTRSVEKFRGSVDTALALLEHENGVHTTLNMSWAALNDEEGHALRVFGTDGGMIVDDKTLKLIDCEGKQSLIQISEGNGFYHELADFHRSITDGVEPHLSPEMALHDVEIIIGILESAESGEKVSL